MDDATEESAANKERPFLPFRNYLVFGRVMRDPEMAKELLERILHIDIRKVEYCNTEQTMVLDSLSKGVRLDLYVKESDRIFNVEMQCGDYDDLGRRMARYQTHISSENALGKGKPGFRDPESFIIFLCVDDPFGHGIPRYDFEMRCAQADGLMLETGFHWIALNSQAYEAERDEGLRNVLRYVRNDEVAPGDLFVERMDSEVHVVNRDKEWVDMVDYLLTYEGQAEWRGYRRGEARLSALINKLLESDRIEDIKRVTTDEGYRQELFEEFGIA